MNKILPEAIVAGCILMIVYKQIPSGTPFRVFLAGFLVHIIRECLGINRWYCARSNARGNVNKTDGVMNNM